MSEERELLLGPKPPGIRRWWSTLFCCGRGGTTAARPDPPPAPEVTRPDPPAPSPSPMRQSFETSQQLYYTKLKLHEERRRPLTPAEVQEAQQRWAAAVAKAVPLGERLGSSTVNN